MPYTQNQLRCLNAMGVVPWIERTPVRSDAGLVQSSASATVRDPIVTNEFDRNNDLQLTDDALQSDSTSSTESAGFLQTPFLQTPLVEIPFRGKSCTQLGKPDALLLILVEANSTQQSQYPFEPADAKIFEDMLRAIAWRRQDVCLGVLPPSSAPSLFADTKAPLVSDLCKPHRDAVLLFRQSVPETSNIDELVVPLERPGMLAWQLPHPALLRESPERKRQAWNVLKAARTRLG